MSVERQEVVKAIKEIIRLYNISNKLLSRAIYYIENNQDTAYHETMEDLISRWTKLRQHIFTRFSAVFPGFAEAFAEHKFRDTFNRFNQN